MSQKEEFEQAGYREYEPKLKALLDAEAGGPYQVWFVAPPVCTARWDMQSWLRFVDWSLAANGKALDAAKRALRVENQDCDGGNNCVTCGAGDYHSLDCERVVL